MRGMDPDLVTPDVTIDVAGLRATASRVEACSTDVAHVDLPGIDPHALPGSVVSVIAGPALVTGRRAGLVNQLAAWATTARTSADQFEHVDGRNADRIHQS
jgi:hypothetical protein